MTVENLLREREKELACVHAICLLAAAAPEPSEVAEGIASALCAAMRYPPLVRCSVSFAPDPAGLSGGGEGARAGGSAIEAVFGAPLPEAGAAAYPRLESRLPEDESLGWSGAVCLEYRDPALAFLPQEEALLGTVLVVTASMLRTANLIARLRASGESLLAKNLALREILSSIEEEKRGLLRSFRESLAAEVLPLAERARDASLSPERRDSYLGLLIKELRRNVALLGPGPDADPSLSPREREVAVQVRNGRTSKEIAELLGISIATVERHRHNIRRKLRVSDRWVNLASLLSNEGSVGNSPS